MDAHAVPNHQDDVGGREVPVRLRNFRHLVGAFQNEALGLRRRKQGRRKQQGTGKGAQEGIHAATFPPAAEQVKRKNVPVPRETGTNAVGGLI